MDEETDILSSEDVLEDVMVQYMYQHFERNLPVGQNLFRGILSDRQHG